MAFLAALGGIAALGNAAGEAVKLGRELLDMKRDEQQQELGRLRQQVEVLSAENGGLRAELEKVRALIGKPGGLAGGRKL